MKEALLYEKLENKVVKCNLCPWRCIIRSKQRGVCQVRLNEEGTLYSLIYGKCSSVAADPIEKKPVFHYQPGSLALSLGTLGCNLRCLHCQNWQIAHADPETYTRSYDRELSDVSPQQVVSLAKSYSCQGVAWTYNEPTIWFEYVLDSAKLCKENNLYTVMVTNGYITFEALDLLGPLIDVFRVDVKGFTKEFYQKLAKIKDFTPILNASVRAKKKWGMHLEIVTNVIPTYNDDPKQLRALARWIKESLGKRTPWHLTRFIPYLELSHLYPTPLETLEKAREIGLEEGLSFVYLGNVPSHHGENTYCYKCGSLVIERAGYNINKSHIDKGKCNYCGADLNIIQ